MNIYYKILNEIAAVFNMDQWDDQVNTFTDVIDEQLNTFVHNTKYDEIYILENEWYHNFPQFYFYKERCYVNGEKVELGLYGSIANKWRDRKTVNVMIEDLDRLGESCAYMFYRCFSLVKVPWFDTSMVTSMYNMFNRCEALKVVPEFDTREVTDMYFMFFCCKSLESVPLFDTSKVTDGMKEMFYGCKSLVSVPLFDTSKVTHMERMFFGCFSLSEKTKQEWSSVYDFETDKMI